MTAILLLSGVHLGLLYGLYVPDWQYEVQLTSSSLPFSDGSVIKTVNCSVRGDLGPSCNSAGMIDRYVLGIEHLYKKPAYRNLKECQTSMDGQHLDNSPSWCQAPFDPEGILGSLMAAVTCIIGLHFGHVLILIEDHKDRLVHWLMSSVLMLLLGCSLGAIGIPFNKQLYTISYMFVTAATAGVTFCALYLLVDIMGYRWLSYVLEWTGQHSLSIFILLASNVAIILIQGFYWRNPNCNIVHWIISLVVHKEHA